MNVTFNTLFSCVLISQAHLELCGYESANGYFSVPLNEFKTPPQDRISNWQFRPVRPDWHVQRYCTRLTTVQVPPFRHGFGEQTFIARAHLGNTVPAGQLHRKPKAPNGIQMPSFRHGLPVQPSNVKFDGVQPNDPIPFPL